MLSDRWWTQVLVGQTDAPHPVHRDAISVKLHGGVLRISGELESEGERRALIAEARRFIGRGLDDVDTRRLTVKRRNHERGILEQTIIAAYSHPELAEYARRFLLEHRNLKILEAETVKSDHPLLDRLGAFAADVRKALDAGNGIVIVRVDEIDAFQSRELLDEDTRSLWTMAMPPVPARKEG